MHAPTLVSSIIDFFFPPPKDVVRIRAITIDTVREKLIVRAKPLPWIFVGFSYRDQDIQSLIRANKFYGTKKASQILGLCMSDMVLKALEERALDLEWRRPLLVPIPSSAKRKRKRGYNQVERIVEYALPFIETSVRYTPNVLKRKERPSQLRTEKKKRVENVSRAFFVTNDEAQRQLVSGECCIVVDDVSETGATLKDARRALLEAGAKEVIGIALAH